MFNNSVQIEPIILNPDAVEGSLIDWLQRGKQESFAALIGLENSSN